MPRPNLPPSGALRSLQERLHAYLLNPAGVDMVDLVVSTPRASAEVRLNIYAESYRLRLIEALETDFPALYALLGEEEFARLGRAYIDAYPSHHFSIRWFGQHLSCFLTETLPYQEQPWLYEMAAFEWALGEAFDAAVSSVVGYDALAALPAAAWPGMYLEAHPSVRRLDLRFNVPAQWKALSEGEGLPPPVASDYPIGWLIWREGLHTFFRSLPVDEAWAIDALLQGGSFAAICEGLCEWNAEEEVALRAAGLMKDWVHNGLITKIQLN